MTYSSATAASAFCDWIFHPSPPAPPNIGIGVYGPESPQLFWNATVPWKLSTKLDADENWKTRSFHLFADGRNQYFVNCPLVDGKVIAVNP